MADKKSEEIVNEAKNFLNFHKKSIGKSIREGKNVIFVNFQDIASFSHFLAEEIISFPEENIQILQVALEEMGFVENPKIRFIDLPDTQFIKIRNIRAKHLNQLISIEGLVRQSSDVRPQVVNAKFECPSCGTIISVLQMEKKFREPSKCSCGRKGHFRLVKKEMVDAQRIVIEESPENLVGGEQPKRISIFLKEDLVDPKMEERTTPGSRVKIMGILKEIPVPLHSGAISTRFDLAVEANNIVPLEETFEELDINEEDETQIQELASDKNLFKKLAKSIAPSIYGYDEVKEALVLQLFGGVSKKRNDGTSIRGDMHILLVGDPGVAKSQLLKFMASLSPKGRYIVGKAATGAGVTATVVRDEFLKGWSLEAGAMVLANKGLVSIDEMDKMDHQDRSAMHEAMEQQCMLPSFRLMLSNGKYIEIGKLVDRLMKKNKSKVYKGKDCEILNVRNIELLSTDFTSHFPINASRVSRHIAPKEFVKIELANGRKIIVTPEHPCWIVKDGKITTLPAEKLKKNMFFPIPSKIIPKTGNYKLENDYLCKILGYYIADGFYELNKDKKIGIQFWNNDQVLINDFKNSVENYFDIKTSLIKRKNQKAVRAISEKIVEKLNSLDKNLFEKGNIRKIPEKIMNFPNENIRYLLRALYDGRGFVISEKRNVYRISFVSQNRELAEQISDLLLRFEIQSSIFKDSNVWRLDILGQENLLRFLTNISFLSQKKKQMLKEYCEKIKTRTIKDIIPNCTNKINKIFKKLKISQRKEVGYLIDNGVEKHRKFLQKLVLIAEKRLKESPNKAVEKDLKEIKKLAFGYSRWGKIKNVKKVENKNIKWVYDVTIEPYHTFISNGMILHNTVTISKANVQATLRAKTSVLAAANPKLGRFEPFQVIAQQIDMPPTLLNRFDVIFTLRDLPDKGRDEAIATHVLLEHKEEGEKQIIERELFRKYIAYAKQKFKPKLTNEAVDQIKRFYVGLRNAPVAAEGASKPIPISARQLEALIRLSEASARTRLSNVVTKDDAKRAINLIKYYLMQVGFDEESKTFDIDRIATGVSTSQRGRIILVREAITRLEGRMGKLIPLEELEKELEEKISKTELEEAVQKLKQAGDIFEPKKGYVQRV
jgi:replicative DNA helicase Mcm